MISRGALTMLGLCTAVLVLAALYFARSILAPVAFSLFVVAIVWPLQRALESRIPRLLALIAALVVTLLVMTVLGALITWAFGAVGRWLIDNALRFQALYIQSTDWLEEHGILVTSLLVENFNGGGPARGRHRPEKHRAPRQRGGGANHPAGKHANRGQVPKIHARPQRNERADRAGGVGLYPPRRPRTGDGVGRDRVRVELHPVHRPARRDGVSDPFRARAIRVLAIDRRRISRSQTHPVPDRKLPRTSHPGGIHRRAHCDCSSHAVRAARLDAMDRDAPVGPRAALVSL